MYGYWYSVKEHFEFSGDELRELFWTTLAFAFVLAMHYGNLFQFAGGDARIVLTSDFLLLFLMLLVFVFIAMYFHVSLQKLVGIRLGYKVTYSYWLNGILIGLFLALLTFGKVPILSVFILPGAVKLEQIQKLRLGKFRYGLNAKDIARVSLAGPLSHILLSTILGIMFFSLGTSLLLVTLIKANLLLLMYSMLPVPKIDFPTRMDSASDGMGLFFYNRQVYVICLVTALAYTVLVWLTTTFSFTLAFLIALLSTLTYSVAMKRAT